MGAAARSHYSFFVWNRTLPIFELLEPRILLSADIIPLSVDSSVDSDIAGISEPLEEISTSYQPAQDTPLPVEPDTTDQTSDQNNAGSEENISLQSDPDAQTSGIDEVNEGQTATSVESPDGNSDTLQEVIFINDDIEGFEELLTDLQQRENSEVIVLSSSEDGLSQVEEALDTTDQIEALHFFTHGTEATVKIGSTWLNETTLTENAESIRSWGESLTEDGDILFYGCNLTATAEGENLIDEIAALTGADIAASSDTTGHVSKNGDWILEYETGEIETIVPVSSTLQSDWLHILAEETFADNFDSGDYSGSSGTVDWVSDWVEIGDDDDASDGNVQITDDSLSIRPAASYDTIRGISRVADLTDAIGGAAYLSFDVDDSWGGTVVIQVRTDSDSSWGSTNTLSYEHEIVWYTPETRLRFDISEYVSATTEIRFVSEGTHYGGLSDTNYGERSFTVDNLNIDYTTDTWSTPLWFSTAKDVNNGGQTGIEDWEEADLIGPR